MGGSDWEEPEGQMGEEPGGQMGEEHGGHLCSSGSFFPPIILLVGVGNPGMIDMFSKY